MMMKRALSSSSFSLFFLFPSNVLKKETKLGKNA